MNDPMILVLDELLRNMKQCFLRTLPKFKLVHQFESQSKLWQVYLDEARPHILN